MQRLCGKQLFELLFLLGLRPLAVFLEDLVQHLLRSEERPVFDI